MNGSPVAVVVVGDELRTVRLDAVRLAPEQIRPTVGERCDRCGDITVDYRGLWACLGCGQHGGIAMVAP